MLSFKTKERTLFSRYQKFLNKRIEISYLTIIILLMITILMITHNVILLNQYYLNKENKVKENILYLENELRLSKERELNLFVKTLSNEREMSIYDEKILIENKVKEIKNDKIENHIGENNFTFKNNTFKQYTLPEVYYPNRQYFFPYMDYRAITARGTKTYKVNNDGNAYTDSLGLRRYKVGNDQFKVNGQDDYMVALGTYYKKYKGEIGGRYLVVTTNGMYTIMTGDEKSDMHTDQHKMVSFHGGKLGMIEFIVYTPALERSIKQFGSVNHSSNKILNGKITHIYRIN